MHKHQAATPEDLLPKEHQLGFALDAGQPGSDHAITPHLNDDLLADKRKWPKDLVEMTDFIHAELDASGITDNDKHLLTEKVLIALCFRSGGRGFYLPQAAAVKTALLHKRIHDEWAASVPVVELIRRYKMSEQAIYGIIKEQRTLHQRKIQPGLFS